MAISKDQAKQQYKNLNFDKICGTSGAPPTKV